MLVRFEILVVGLENLNHKKVSPASFSLALKFIFFSFCHLSSG